MREFLVGSQSSGKRIGPAVIQIEHEPVNGEFFRRKIRRHDRRGAGDGIILIESLKTDQASRREVTIDAATSF
jgi:hypothetical protein